MKTVCCECGEIISDGPQIKTEISHGFCRVCFDVIMAFLEGRPYDRERAKQIKTIGN